MKKARIFGLVVLTWILILSCIPITLAKTPGYVGIKENDTFIWNTTYDDSPIMDYEEDRGEEYGWTDEQIEENQDEIDMNEDLTQVKIVVLDVDDDEKEKSDKDYVRIIYNHYMKEEGGEWDLENKDETYATFQDDKEVYSVLTFACFFLTL